ncbi:MULTISPECIES: GNAT family N-acetyltransferase [unclassified Streptomyces]|uniref:GNAT family N-acetyltransferase n=1 Tax=unclassified Streptomyces TaxID=2593676 RepID=UPI0006AFE7AD|nr:MULTISPECIES: GNAT family N-acetyltransferase [unclassified Streptomyces]KOX19307.1 alanine acetyltransferase [Streptomyces sp. NRRL F-6491]KOX37533.1 alanine acetyltransferase [Streptomyces sp. NRRL F-6492]
MTAEGPRIRPAAPDDAPALARAVVRNREYMKPWEPYRAERYYTVEGQVERLADGGVRWFAVDGDEIVGVATLSGIVRGPLCGASLGYWIDRDHAGRGLATALVAEACRAAREELGLHRVEAGTLLDNHASQRVLAKGGFVRIGTAPRLLHIDGEWRDHHLFQRLLHDDPPPA